ncbi:Transmembrane protein 53 [Trebouxia sp. C0010 RCD-2024]
MMHALAAQRPFVGKIQLYRPRLQAIRLSPVTSAACSLAVSPRCLRVTSGTSSKYTQGHVVQRIRALQTSSQATNAQKPLVVLIGWLGAKEQHFNKYVELWQQMGHATYGYRPPTPSIVFPPVGSAKAADVIRDIELLQHNKAEQPVIYHIFRLSFLWHDAQTHSCC